MNGYAYSYRVGLTTVRKDVKCDFTKDKINEDSDLIVEEYIKDKLGEFSRMSQNSARNRKCIDMETIQVTEDCIVFTLYSEKELPAVGKSIRLFSQLLLAEEYFINLLLNNKLLFKTYVPVEVEDEETGKVEVIDASDSVTDSDFVKALIDFLLTPQYPYTKEKNNISNGIKEMKAIAVKTGLIKL